ncbi:MAG: hypothetical protein F2844_01025 [Actinobacteria bacterium]|nr:hypothetical protein [Actinomycetota bacterium]
MDAGGKITSRVENPKFCGFGLSKDKPFCDGSHKEKTQQ